jgi:hypothetical protein
VERFHQVNRAFAALNIGSVFAGIAFKETAIDLNVLLLTVILIMMRVKFWLDDEAYLEDVDRGVHEGGLSFGVGIFLAISSWIAWAFAGLFIKDIELCSSLMLIVFVISTFWIIAAMIKRGAYAEQVPWLFFNCFYSLCFFLIIYRTATWNPFRENYENFTTGVIFALFFFFIADLALTRILEQRRRQIKPKNL